MAKITNIAKITKEQIAAWKKEHESVFKLEVDGKVAYLKTPDRKTMGYATLVNKKDPLKFNEVLLENCWLDGDKEIQTNDTLFMSVAGELAQLLDFKEAKLEKI